MRPACAGASRPCARRRSWTSDAKAVTATPSPTEPVEKSTSSWSLVRDGYDCAPPKARKRRSWSASCRPRRYWMACHAGLACGLTATRSSGRSTPK